MRGSYGVLHRFSLWRRCVQVRLGAMEEEAVRRDAVRAARALLGVQAAAGHRPPHKAHPPRQGPPPRLQGQAGRSPLLTPLARATLAMDLWVGGRSGWCRDYRFHLGL